MREYNRSPLELRRKLGPTISNGLSEMAGTIKKMDGGVGTAGTTKKNVQLGATRGIPTRPRRKKKTYTKPKKIKHKQKKVKLAVLQFYKVDDSTGKVTRLRKECPNNDCGAGTFMANHFDRHYCGKCGLTYLYNKQAE
ncbi:hypothetical protein FCM35_KLT15682 [Carex littledalei]|uniref:Small ribosomal subunit protein eS31 domain-containing protein n=1 Tax=Carex littledalei TaxID=544730 RepID=A0A833VJ13_9POAL|nr:hypothetical protein FCM35_KLT15682 [Carex littledalei]